jgi:Flp pilus assembly protein TadD
MYRRDQTTVFRNNDFGFGINIPVVGAANFVEQEGITGTLFNTYNQGGYLLFRFSPDRKVFADGRNIEYGYPFIQKILDAGTNPARWKELDQTYKFTYAIVEYKSMPEYGMTRPYISNLDADATWQLVYLDDIATVYVRALPQYAAIIKKYAYNILTPHALEFTDVLDQLPEKQWKAAEKELLRVAAESPSSIKPRILLANRYLSLHRPDEAKVLMLQALEAQPYRSEIYEILGRISVENQDWAQAGAYLEKAAMLAGSGGPEINYDYLAMIFSKSGENDKAEMYHRKAVRAGQQSPVAGNTLQE